MISNDASMTFRHSVILKISLRAFFTNDLSEPYPINRNIYNHISIYALLILNFVSFHLLVLGLFDIKISFQSMEIQSLDRKTIYGMWHDLRYY